MEGRKKKENEERERRERRRDESSFGGKLNQVFFGSVNLYFVVLFLSRKRESEKKRMRGNFFFI